MRNVTRKFRIGEKISLGFGLVGCLFLIVIWRYHSMLDVTMQDYQRLLEVYVARLNHAQTIEQHILSARIAEKNFVISRQQSAAEQVKAGVNSVLASTQILAGLGQDDKQIASKIDSLAQSYEQAFNALVTAWRVKGVDYNSGLQGAFRESIHELETLAAQFETGELYVLLLQIRRAEKDLGLRRESQYQDKVATLIERFKSATDKSALKPAIKVQLAASLEAYAIAFAHFASQVLAGENIAGGRGPFRDIAHTIEALLNQYYVPELKADILQLRRREKDYLLRGEQQYIDMVAQLIPSIGRKAAASGISAADKRQFSGLLADYQRDFLALVEQNQQISLLMQQMEDTVLGITREVQLNVTLANAKKLAMVSQINEASAAGERQLFWIVLFASSIGIVFAVVIIYGISRPLRRMVSILDQLSFEEATERMPYLAGGRDEVNAMAGSVNTMADHRHQFIRWWQASMAEAEAIQGLQSLAAKSGGDLAEVSSNKRQRMAADLTVSSQAKQALLRHHLLEVERLNEETLQGLNSLLSDAHLAHTKGVLKQLRQAAQNIKSKLAMVLFKAAD